MSLLLMTVCQKSAVISSSNKTGDSVEASSKPLKNPSSTPEHLSPDEEMRLKTSILQALKWSSVWHGYSFDCYKEKEGSHSRTFGETNESFEQLYKRLEGKEINVRLKIEPWRITAYIVEMNASIRFNYAVEEETSEKPVQEQIRHLAPEPPERLCSLPEITQSYELRQYLIPRHEDKKESKKDWSDEKKQLLENILEIAKEDSCKSSSYVPKKPIQIVVPNFEIGDPEIYVLFKSQKIRYEGGKSIDWININYSAPELIRNFGEPNEIEGLSTQIEESVVYRTTVVCE